MLTIINTEPSFRNGVYFKEGNRAETSFQNSSPKRQRGGEALWTINRNNTPSLTFRGIVFAATSQNLKNNKTPGIPG
ncbi:MAG: hypothetical protein FWC50_04870 [Planctomycetaceae bacterium]|nr:hypothetical protein [Planctomycetaceae bacterium]